MLLPVLFPRDEFDRTYNRCVKLINIIKKIQHHKDEIKALRKEFDATKKQDLKDISKEKK